MINGLSHIAYLQISVSSFKTFQLNLLFIKKKKKSCIYFWPHLRGMQNFPDQGLRARAPCSGRAES